MNRLKLTPDRLAENVPGSRVVRLPDNWFEKVVSSLNIYEQLYAWLVDRLGIAPNGLHNRARVGMKLEKELRQAEGKRLKRQGLRGDALRRAVNFRDADSGPMSLFAERKLTGEAICILPPESKEEDAFIKRLLKEEFKSRIQRAKVIRTKRYGATFFDWMDAIKECDDQIGDIAKDIAADPDFPRDAKSFHEILSYYNSARWALHEDVMECLKKAWLEYATKYPKQVVPGAWCEFCEELLTETDEIVFIRNGPVFEVMHKQHNEQDYGVWSLRLKTLVVDIEAILSLSDEELDPEEELYSSAKQSIRQRLRFWGLTTESLSETKVYFIQSGDTGPIKIGITKNVKKRLEGLQTAHPVPLKVLLEVEASHSFEKEMHARFSVYRKEGEWFSPHPELLEYIKNAVATGDR